MRQDLPMREGRHVPTVGAIVRYRKVKVGEIKIFYREAGSQYAPALLLLHGFPTASHMSRNLIPRLADRFRLIALDLPGFGQSDMPARDSFPYTFDNLARVIDQFTELVGLSRFAIYIFDYGAPVGLRIALKKSEQVTAIVSQKGNAYEEGLRRGPTSLREYWQTQRKKGEMPCAARSHRRRRVMSTCMV